MPLALLLSDEGLGGATEREVIATGTGPHKC